MWSLSVMGRFASARRAKGSLRITTTVYRVDRGGRGNQATHGPTGWSWRAKATSRVPARHGRMGIVRSAADPDPLPPACRKPVVSGGTEAYGEHRRTCRHLPRRRAVRHGGGLRGAAGTLPGRRGAPADAGVSESELCSEHIRPGRGFAAAESRVLANGGALGSDAEALCGSPVGPWRPASTGGAVRAHAD